MAARSSRLVLVANATVVVGSANVFDGVTIDSTTPFAQCAAFGGAPATSFYIHSIELCRY